jgi:uncharacterized protein YjbJ (UPF0337 family)
MQAISRADFLRGNQDEKDQVKGSTENIRGKFQEQAGKSTGGKEQEAKGIGKAGDRETFKRSWGC